MPATMDNLNAFSTASSTTFGKPSNAMEFRQKAPIESPTSSTAAFITSSRSSNGHQNAIANGNENISKLLFASTMANNNSASSVSPSSSSPSSSASSAPTAQQNVGISPFNFLPSFGADLQKIIARNFEDQIRQNAQFNQLLFLEEEEKQRRKQALLYNKTISHEKRKFTPPISDFMVLEVLKRKNYLVEHNTSRDLKFSEEKRKAWETVRDLLKERFAGFTMGIENIKSHWRYRKRKVTDAANEIRGPDIEDKLREKLGNEVDFRIYLELKASNMLDSFDDDSPPMPLANSNNIADDDDGTMNFSNSTQFPMQFDGQYQKSQNDQLAQLLKNNSNASAAALFPANVPSPLLDFFKLQQIKQMTDINFNANLPKIDNNNPHSIGQQNGQIMLDVGRKRAAELNVNLAFGQNGIHNCQPPKMHKNDGGIVKEENGDSNDEEEDLIIDEDGTTMMECTNQNEEKRKIEENVVKVENAVPMEMNGQINALIQAQIEAANAQKELANLQKSATVEWLKAAKNINEVIPKLGAAIEKYMKEE